jgi:argininosuccinate synthase
MGSGQSLGRFDYHPQIATMEADPTKACNQDDATGFIRLNALRLKVAAKVQRKR